MKEKLALSTLSENAFQVFVRIRPMDNKDSSSKSGMRNMIRAKENNEVKDLLLIGSCVGFIQPR